ncbi:MAG: GNAT family N-acetyltransferase [Aquihabitans sp.]
MDVGVFEPSQRSSLVDLLCELAQHEGTPEPGRLGVERHLATSILAPGSPVTLVTAVGPNVLVEGFAALVLLPSLVESSGPGRHQCLMKELFVSERARGEGIGAQLLHWSARFAIDHGCGRMDWNVKAANQAGIRFYERHGAQPVPDRLSYRVSGAALGDLAGAAAGNR